MCTRAISALVLVAATQAQVQLSGTNDLRVSRTVTTDMAARIENIENVLIPQAINGAQQQAFNATITAMAATTAQIMALSSTVNEMQAGLTAQVSSMNSNVVASESRLRDSLADSLSQTVASLPTEEDIQGVLQDGLDEITRTADTAAAAQTATVNAAVSSLTSAVAAKADNTAYMWTGGCAQHSTGSGWATYCLNQAHHANFGGKFAIAGGNKFQARTAGYFSMHYFGMFRTSGWHHIRMFMDGSQKTYGYNRETYHEGGNAWRDGFGYAMFPVRSGQMNYVQSYVDSWYRWHRTNVKGEHSRVTFRYHGQTA